MPLRCRDLPGKLFLGKLTPWTVPAWVCSSQSPVRVPVDCRTLTLLVLFLVVLFLSSNFVLFVSGSHRWFTWMLINFPIGGSSDWKFGPTMYGLLICIDGGWWSVWWQTAENLFFRPICLSILSCNPSRISEKENSSLRFESQSFVGFCLRPRAGVVELKP